MVPVPCIPVKMEGLSGTTLSLSLSSQKVNLLAGPNTSSFGVLDLSVPLILRFSLESRNFLRILAQSRQGDMVWAKLIPFAVATRLKQNKCKKGGVACHTAQVTRLPLIVNANHWRNGA